MPADTPEVWRGRLSGLDPRARALNDSLPVDLRLWPEELALSRAYALTLAECGIMSAAEADSLGAACHAIETELSAGTLTLQGEDIHSAIEAELIRRSGDPGRKLHTGRSRNDQVSTLLRMHVIHLCDDAVEHLRELERALVHQARRSGNQAVAAYTHLQPAQPVLLAQWWLAHVTAFERDETRFLEAREAADLMPLGSGAIGGTPLRYDRAALATRLGFSRLAENSLDAVGDRDFAVEYLNAGSLLGVHLSRLAEDLVLMCSSGFGWFVPPDGFSTGSSLLPQKRNPDIFELTRGKAGRLIANAQRLIVLLKGLPSGYQKDLQEDKEAIFDTADTLSAVLAALAPAVAALAPVRDRIDASLTPELLAVELADALVQSGVPFRDAHAAVGALWARAEKAGVLPNELPEAERLRISPHFTTARLAALSVESALSRRDHAPGGGPGSVAAQLRRAEARLGLGGSEQGPERSEAATSSGAVEARSETLETGGKEPAGPRAGATDPLVGREEASEQGPERSEVEARLSSGAEAGAGAPREQRSGGRMPEPRGSREVPPTAPAILEANSSVRDDGVVIRRARLDDVPGIAAIMADYVVQGVLLPRPVSELYQCIREFHVAENNGEIVACAALRLLWDDLGEVRSLAVRPDHHGRGLGAVLVSAVLDDARSIAVPRVIALTREIGFFESCGFSVVSRDTLPRKVWTDCVRCPRRHACDEVAVVIDLIPGASEAAAAAGRSWTLPIPHLLQPSGNMLPVIS